MTDAERYAISVKKVIVEDEEYWRATVRELPDLAEFADSREEAIDLAIDAIESLKAAAGEEGRPFPEPISDEEEYSGRVTLRLAKSLHRAVALSALEEDVSLNTYISNALMSSVRVGAAKSLTAVSDPAMSSGLPNTYIVRAPHTSGFGVVAVGPLYPQAMGHWSMRTIASGAPGARYWDLSGGNTVAAIGASINVEAPQGDAIQMFGKFEDKTRAPLAFIDKSERRRRA